MNMDRMDSWSPILEKLKGKLSVWKAKTLSFGGRITLAKDVLGSLPTYYMFIFDAPIGVIKSLEKNPKVVSLGRFKL